MKRKIGTVVALAVSLLALSVPVASSPAQACAWRWNGSSWSCL